MDVLIPGELEEALELKSSRPECVPIAGGTDLMVEMNFGRRHPTAIMDVSRIAALKEWRTEKERIFVGAGMTYTRAIRDLSSVPALATASRTVGSPQIRNRGTIGGNLATASPAGDALPVLACLDAEVVLARKGSMRAVPWNRFLKGPKRSCLEPDELILGVRWKTVHGPSVFSKVGSRNAMVIAVASMCLILDTAKRSVRVAVGSVAPTVIRLPEVEHAIDDVLATAGVWRDPDVVPPEGEVDEVGRLVEASISPIDDIRGTADYRRHTCGVLFRRALRWCLEERPLARG